MTDSRTPTTNRIIRPGIIASGPAGPGPPYIPGSQFQLVPPRAMTQITGTPATIQHSLINTSAVVTTHFQVPLQAVATKPLTVVTNYKSNPGGGGSASVTFTSHPSIEKITTPLTTVSVDGHIKANVKSMPLQKVSYMKQIPTIVTKAAPFTASIVQTAKKDLDSGKPVPVLVGPGLRQPLKPQQPQVLKPNMYGDSAVSRNASLHTSSWVIHQHQQDAIKSTLSSIPASVVRTKPLFQNSTVVAALPHDLSKKHIVSQQPKSTISIMPTLSNIPPPEAIHRNAALTPTSTLSIGNKPIYQVVPGYSSQIHGQANSIKKLPVLVTQGISLANSTSNSATGFIAPVLSSGQITVMTCGSGITYVPAPTPPNGTNSAAIPIAKVYPQQQPTSRISVASVPVISSVTASSLISRTTPSLIQVGSIKSTPTTSTVMTTQNTIVSTTINKPVTNIEVGPIFCWSKYNSLPPATAISGATVRPNLTVTSTSNQSPGAIRPHGLLLVDNPRTAHLQGTVVSVPSMLQVNDTTRGNAPHNSSNSPGVGPTTPTMSPKPAILRRGQRPDSSNALKKLSFPSTTPNFQNQRRDFQNVKPTDRRGAPYTTNRTNIQSNLTEAKTNEISLVHPGSGQSEKNEVKPVLANQVYGKQIITSNGFTPLKINNIKSHSGLFPNSGKDGGQTFSIHPSVNIDLKVKMEPGHSLYSTPQNLIKSESTSASQMLHYQNISMHSYAAESPKTTGTQHQSVAKASGQHIRTNTIFTKQVSQQYYPGQQRPKPAQVPKSVSGSAPVSSTGVTSTTQPTYFSHKSTPMSQSNHGFNTINRRFHNDHQNDRISVVDHNIKKEQSRMKQLSGLEQIRSPGDGFISQINNRNTPNHSISPAKLWSHVNNIDPIAGLSPRKRPRKQTHVVSEDPPEVVMEDEESTDDADECEDEPNSQTPDISATLAIKLPGHKPCAQQPLKVEQTSNKKMIREEISNKSAIVKSESFISPSNNETKPLSEYTDYDGVRYVATRKRPAVSVLNRLKPNSRAIANHYLHYSDIKVKDKKVSLSDLAYDKKRLKGIKVARLAFQLQDMVECEKDVCQRMQSIYDGLVAYKSSLVSETMFDSTLASPSPGTPTSLSNSFRKATPRSNRSNSLSQAAENGPLNSPSTPLDRRTHKVNDNISIIEELAQANLQRCRVVSDQLLDTKTILLKSIDHRQLVTDILESPSNQKTQSHASSVTTQSTKRMSKKKSNS